MAIRNPKFWTELDKYIGESYPKFIEHILIACGFDNKGLLKLITGDTVKDIENFVRKNTQFVKNTSYEKTIDNLIENFEFSLGHRILITSIPAKIKEFDAEKKLKKQNCDQETLKNVLLTKIQKYSKKIEITIRCIGRKYNFFLKE